MNEYFAELLWLHDRNDNGREEMCECYYFPYCPLCYPRLSKVNDMPGRWRRLWERLWSWMFRTKKPEAK